MQPESSAAAILARLDRSSPDKLLASLAEELALLHRAHQAMLAKIAALETFQAMSDRVLEPGANAPTELPCSVTVDAAFSLSAENGFYGIEYDAKGIPYRWTGPEAAFYFELLVDRSSTAMLTLRYLKIFGQVSPQNKLRCFVDGQSVTVSTREIDGEFELNAELPLRNANSGSVIMFLCPTSKAPQTAGSPADRRSLGLAFRWLKIDRTADAGQMATDTKPLDMPHRLNEDAAKLELVRAVPNQALHGESAARKNRS